MKQIVRRILFIILLTITFSSIAFAATDVDQDTNGDIDEAYGGTNASALDLITADLTGKQYIVNVSSSCTIGTNCDSTATSVAYGGIIRVTSTAEVTLPSIATGGVGMSVCFYCKTASQSITITPNASDKIELLDDLGADGEHIINSSCTVGDMVCVVAGASDGWETWGTRGTWAAETP